MLLFWKRNKPAYTDGVIDLVPIDLFPPPEEMGFGDNYDFVITPHGKKREAGRINLRLGESEAVYYFGHIGYHVDPPYRGHGYAARACALLKDLIVREGKGSVVITADPDNIPSRKTCEKLGCTLENIVGVPVTIQDKWEISSVKCRYIWRMNQQQ
ncbi:MAG: GNAT family N-acetyltransferase [Clostridia bacterium]|nr:GNAT family N-acetyltransferase [Clostridia bacterium]